MARAGIRHQVDPRPLLLRRRERVTGKQMRMARGVAHDIGWDDPKRLDGLVAKMFDPKNRLELLNKKEGSKLIVALERMRDEVRDGIREFA